MTASPVDNLTPRGLLRNLTLRFSSLLFLFLILLGGVYLAVSSAVAAKEYDSGVMNLAGRQRMLTQKYAREINQALVGFAVSDWKMAVEMKECASRTAKVYEDTFAAFLEGGEVDAGADGRIWIPPAQGVDFVEHLGHVKTEWEKLHGIALLAMRSDSSPLARSDFVRNIQTQTAKTVTEMDHAVLHLQKQSEAKLRRVGSYVTFACILGVILFFATVAFVRSRIVAPLDHSMTALETEITERKRAEEALQQAMAESRESVGRLERFNRLAVGREHQMIELKRQINELAAELGRSPLHDLSFLQTAEAPGGQDGA